MSSEAERAVVDVKEGEPGGAHDPSKIRVAFEVEDSGTYDRYYVAPETICALGNQFLDVRRRTPC